MSSRTHWGWPIHISADKYALPTIVNEVSTWSDFRYSELSTMIGNLDPVLLNELVEYYQGDLAPADGVVAAHVNTPSTATRAALDGNYDSHARANARAILVSDYGTLGTSNDSATIAAALNAANGRRVVFPPGATLSTHGSTVNGLAHAVIDGNGATLRLNGTGSARTALLLDGVLDDVKVTGVAVEGTGVVADAHVGIAVAPTATTRDLEISDNRIENVVNGIDATTGTGSVQGLRILRNFLDGLVGAAAGQGYGIHVSGQGTELTNPPAHAILVADNTILNAGRHSIYHGRGRGSIIARNLIVDHRSAYVGAGSALAAIMVARAGDIIVTGNQVIRPAGGALYLGGPEGGATLGGPYLVSSNMLIDPQDASALVTIGQQAPATAGTARAVDFVNNLLSAAVARQLLTVHNALGLAITGNRFRMPGSGQNAITLLGSGVTGSDYLQDVDVSDNKFDVATNAAIRLASAVSGGTARLRFRGNRRNPGTNMFILSAAATNPNITVADQPVSGLSLASGVWPTDPQLNGQLAGGGPAPGTIAGYLTVNVNGTTRQIPYY